MTAAGSALCLSCSEWCTRLLTASLQSLVLGGLVPLLLHCSRKSTPLKSLTILWHLCVIGGALSTFFAWGEGMLLLEWMLPLTLIYTLQTFRSRRRTVSFLLATLIMSGSLSFSLLLASGNVTEGNRLFLSQGCIWCHLSAEDSFSGLPNRLEARLTQEGKNVANPREWFYLHLYAPEASGDPCPPMPSLFRLQEKPLGAPSPWALPVRLPERLELVPSAEARHLANALLSLRTPGPHKASSKASPIRGEALFFSKCAACHGRNGLGDGVNYPPLTDRAWLTLPPAELRSLILNGKTGKIIVHGREWNSTMSSPGVASEQDAESVRLYLLQRFAPSDPPENQ